MNKMPLLITFSPVHEEGNERCFILMINIWLFLLSPSFFMNENTLSRDYYGMRRHVM